MGAGYVLSSWVCDVLETIIWITVFFDEELGSLWNWATYPELEERRVGFFLADFRNYLALTIVVFTPYSAEL